MSSRITINFGSDAYNQKLKPCHGNRSLLDISNCTIIFSDSGIGNWRGVARPTLEEARAVSQLADLLGPFIEVDAELAALNLVRRFGTLANILAASPDALAGVGSYERPLALLVSAARQLVTGGMRDAMQSMLVEPGSSELAHFVKCKLWHRPTEELIVIFADGRGQYIRDEFAGKGNSRAVCLHLGTLFRRAFELGASRFLLAHNHPSASPKPSSEDVSATRQVRLIGQALEIELIDHLIVAGSRVFSMKHAGLLL